MWQLWGSPACNITDPIKHRLLDSFLLPPQTTSVEFYFPLLFDTLQEVCWGKHKVTSPNQGRHCLIFLSSLSQSSSRLKALIWASGLIKQLEPSLSGWYNLCQGTAGRRNSELGIQKTSWSLTVYARLRHLTHRLMPQQHDKAESRAWHTVSTEQILGE